MTYLLLFLTAILLCVVIVPIATFYKIIKSIYLREFEWGWFKTLAYSLDQTGNVFAKDLFNDTLINRNATHKFGKPDESISSVIGKNKLDDTLTIIGEGLRATLSLFEKNHSIKSIEHDE